MMKVEEGPKITVLPTPRLEGPLSLEEAFSKRRSVRSYQDGPLNLEQVSQLLWAAQGITGSGGFRTAPSAGALYPLEIYVVAGDVVGLASGIYRYEPRGHRLTKTVDGDLRRALCQAALGQMPVRKAPMTVVITAVFQRTTDKYGERGIRYVYLEAGHAAQNLCLQAVSLGLGTVVIGAFRDKEVSTVMKIQGKAYPLYVIPVGRK